MKVKNAAWTKIILETVIMEKFRVLTLSGKMWNISDHRLAVNEMSVLNLHIFLRKELQNFAPFPVSNKYFLRFFNRYFMQFRCLCYRMFMKRLDWFWKLNGNWNKK